MLATLTGTGLAGAYGARDLFADLDVIVAPGDTVGLVGPNGSGKTTLLKILAGLEPPAAGTVATSPPDASVGYLAQVRTAEPGQSVAAFLRSRTGVEAAQRALDEATEALSREAPGSDDAYTDALDRWLALGGADLDERAEALADRLELRVGLERDFATLSGGQNARAGLMSILLSRYDILLLDEPTNDLDADGLDLLEEFMAGLRIGSMVVSHDREFLARTVDSVLEIDASQHKTRFIRAGYDTYLVERQRQRDAERAGYEEYAGRRDALVDRARTQRSWLDKGMAAAKRSAGDTDKLTRKARIESTGQQAAKARQTQRMMERLEEVAEPRKEWELRFELPPVARSGEVVVQLRSATVERGDFTLGPVSLQVSWADRIAITGPNGAGKSTLLRLMLGQLAPTTGTAALGRSVILGEVDQARSLFDGPESLAEAFAHLTEDLNDGERRTLLAKFGLTADHVNRAAGSLSPGERTRAALALLQHAGANLLVLDEPTNHLDLPAIEQLEQVIESFPGTLLLVSHDRQLLGNVSVNRRLEVASGRVTEVSL